jgi:redox-sensitive bicupin YhaK (pirin superfamily)
MSGLIGIVTRPASWLVEKSQGESTILDAGALLPMPDNHEDRGIYATGGSIEATGDNLQSGQMIVFRPGDAITIKASLAWTRLMLVGGVKHLSQAARLMTCNGSSHCRTHSVRVGRI